MIFTCCFRAHGPITPASPQVHPRIIQRIVEMREHSPENLQRTPGPRAILYYLHRDQEGLRTSARHVLVFRILRVKTSHVLPDAISFHWYPCSQDSETTCLSKADTAGKIAMRVRALVKKVLGIDLPIGITEWNFDPSNPPPAYDEDKNFMNSFTKTALQSMMQANVAFACQFDAASYAGYGHLDMFDRNGHPKAQYYTIKALIATYMPS